MLQGFLSLVLFGIEIFFLNFVALFTRNATLREGYNQHLTLFCELGVCNTRAHSTCVGITKTAVK